MSSTTTTGVAVEDRSEGVVVVPEAEQKPAVTATPAELKQLLEVIEKQIVPLTEEGVSKGNKVFGAAILPNPDNLTDNCFCATNAETGK